MKKTLSVLLLLAVIAGMCFWAYKNMQSKDHTTASLVDRGRYLVQVGGCNDCHTPGYAMKGGKVDESLWLTGEALGWQGPWGTTYSINLRNYMQTLTEDQWIQVVPTLKSRPPMPYYNLQHMTEEDLRAIYQYVHAAGPAGQQMPPYLPPGVQAATPVVVFPAPPPG